MNNSRLLQRGLDVLWALTLISLPITSFPAVQEWVGAIVAPFSALPVLLLVLVWFFPYLLRRGELPRESQPVLAFVVVAVLVSLLAFFSGDIPSFKGKTMLGQELRAFFTVGIGLGFYALFATFPGDHPRLRSTMRWINIGGVILVIWTSFQIYYIYVRPSDIPEWVLDLQGFLVVESPYSFVRGFDRLSGLAYEPSWFTHQLNILYFPLWIAATIQRYSAFKWRFFRLSVENLLLVIGSVEFFLGKPRVGLLAFLLLLVFVFLKLNLLVYRRLIEAVSKSTFLQSIIPAKALPAIKFLVGMISLLVMLGVYIMLMVGLINLGSQYDWRLEFALEHLPNWEEIKAILTFDDRMLLWVSNRFLFLERMTYWVTGWNVFNHHPWLGVGLGNAGFYFPQSMPYQGWASYEIRDIFFRSTVLPNIKSFWVRLLAETGLVGFAVFGTWIYILWRSARRAYHANNPTLKTLALAGELSLIAFLVEGFSVDSFAMPYLWIMTGLIAATRLVYSRGLRGDTGERKNLGPTLAAIQEEDADRTK